MGFYKDKNSHNLAGYYETTSFPNPVDDDFDRPYGLDMSHFELMWNRIDWCAAAFCHAECAQGGATRADFKWEVFSRAIARDRFDIRRHSDIDFAATDDDGHLYREEGFDEMFPKSREWREFADFFYGADYDYSGTLPSLECKLDDVGVVTGAVYADAEVSFVMDGDETSALRFRSFSTTIERNN